MNQLITTLDDTLDLFFTDHPSQIIDVNMLPSMSDHDIMVITADIKSKFIDRSSRKTLLYHKANWNAIRESLSALVTEFLQLRTENSDVEDLWSTFKNTMITL